MELLVSKIRVIDRRSDKEAEDWWLLTKFNFIYKYNNFWSMWSSPYGFLNLEDNPITFVLKVSVLDLTYIRRHTYLERSELCVFIFLNISMFVVNLADLIMENKSVNGIFLRN